MLKELFAKHGVDNAELLAEVEGQLTAAESKQTDGIPYKRFKEKVEEVNNLKADLAEKEIKIEKLESKSKTVAEEVNRLKGIEAKHQKVVEATQKKQADLWESRKKVFEVAESDPTFEKVQKIIGKFKIGDELTPDQIEVNNNLYDTYDEIEYFGKPTTSIIDEQQTRGAPPTTKYKSPFDD